MHPAGIIAKLTGSLNNLQLGDMRLPFGSLIGG
jgi:hypothetical protein